MQTHVNTLSLSVRHFVTESLASMGHQDTPCELTSCLTCFTVTQAEGLKPDRFPVTFFPYQESPVLEEIHPLRGQALDILNLEDCGKAYM